MARYQFSEKYFLFCFIFFPVFRRSRTTTTTKPLIPNKLGYARNEIQSEITEVIDLKDKKKNDSNSDKLCFRRSSTKRNSLREAR
jgi:hypothetical protein